VGRLEQALKRANGETPNVAPPSASHGSFVSAWLVDDTALSSASAPLRRGTVGTTPGRPLTPAQDESLAVQPPVPQGQSASPARVDEAAGSATVRQGPGAARPASNEQVQRVFVSAPPDSLPALNAAWGERLTCNPKCDPVLVEQFRRLAAVLHKSQAIDGTRVVMVTSAAQADGKTLTAINLALTLSGSYKRRVLLIDADLRRPSAGESMGLHCATGLSDALKAKQEQLLALIPVTPTLSLLPAGRTDPDPIGGLTSERMRRIVQEAATCFEWVIVDAPPVGLLADANLLADEVDRTLLVVRAGQTQYPLVEKAIEAVGRDRLLGVVLNGVEPETTASYYYDLAGR
jgi:capsular exopolysaccharide synthesis family protein